MYLREYKTVTGEYVTVTFEEKELENPISSIIPKIAGDSYSPDKCYRIIVMGGDHNGPVPGDTLIRDHLAITSKCPGTTIHFAEFNSPKAIKNKWQALSLERYMPTELINIITSYSAEIPSRSRFLGTLNYKLIDDTKASLSILFSVFKSSLRSYSPRVTSTELLQQLNDDEMQHILDEKGNLTTTAKELINRISKHQISIAGDTKREAENLSNDVLSLASTGQIAQATESNCTTGQIAQATESNCTTGEIAQATESNCTIS